MRLPDSFLAAMRELLQEEYPAYLDSFSEEAVSGIRVNTAKITAEEFARISPFALVERVPWASNGFYVQADAQASKHPYYPAGLYYVQEPSAMLPAVLLDAAPGDTVLDLCAAPGGKATELGSRLQGKGLLIANDISASRARGLLKNLELHGIGNMMVCSESPENLLSAYGQIFDKILVDAPCSGEGMFRRNADMLKTYGQRGPQYYAPLQRQIASAAARMLKPGGRMVYSTCTFSRLENEETIAYLLKEFPELAVEKPDPAVFKDSGVVLTEEGFLRLFPHRVRGEGHFAAVLRKKANGSAAIHQKSSASLAGAKERQLFLEFSGRYLKKDISGWPLINIDGRLYTADPGQIKKGLRYLRTGLYLGDLKKQQFEPSQALAMSLKKEDVSSALLLSSQDARVYRYLKGETLELTQEEAARSTGWTLVCADGYPLGWAKWAGGSLRNKYYAGWRIN